jgi:hypothetical protein
MPVELWRERAPRLDYLHGIALGRVWVSDAGIIAELVIQKADLELLVESRKESIARILRLVADCAAQVGRRAPVGAVFVFEGQPQGMRSNLRQLSEDQEWHRGDFFVHETCFHSDEEASAAVVTLLAPFTRNAFGGRSIGRQPPFPELIARMHDLAEEQAGSLPSRKDTRTREALHELLEALSHAVVHGQGEQVRARLIERIRADAAAAAHERGLGNDDWGDEG